MHVKIGSQRYSQHGPASVLNLDLMIPKPHRSPDPVDHDDTPVHNTLKTV